jgi:hypothetical protein
MYVRLANAHTFFASQFPGRNGKSRNLSPISPLRERRTLWASLCGRGLVYRSILSCACLRPQNLFRLIPLLLLVSTFLLGFARGRNHRAAGENEGGGHPKQGLRFGVSYPIVLVLTASFVPLWPPPSAPFVLPLPS